MFDYEDMGAGTSLAQILSQLGAGGDSSPTQAIVRPGSMIRPGSINLIRPLPNGGAGVSASDLAALVSQLTSEQQRNSQQQRQIDYLLSRQGGGIGPAANLYAPGSTTPGACIPHFLGTTTLAKSTTGNLTYQNTSGLVVRGQRLILGLADPAWVATGGPAPLDDVLVTSVLIANIPVTYGTGAPLSAFAATSQSPIYFNWELAPSATIVVNLSNINTATSLAVSGLLLSAVA